MEPVSFFFYIYVCISQLFYVLVWKTFYGESEKISLLKNAFVIGSSKQPLIYLTKNGWINDILLRYNTVFLTGFFDQPWTWAGRIREPGGRVDLGQYGSPLIWYGGLSISANIGHLTIIQFKNQFILLVHVISMVWCKFSSPCHLAPFTPKFEKSGPKPIKSPILFPITRFSLNEDRYVERMFWKSDQWRVFLQESIARKY